ncbi:MAG: hypothetical protein M9962_15180, partial [Oligoflexia bacterium]|nr:hypothetical protein [Oligoflexia bacterium]
TGESFKAIQPPKGRLPRDITKQEIIHIYSDYASELREFHRAGDKRFAVPSPEHRNAPLAQILYMMTDSIVYLHNRIQPLKSEVYKTESILKTRTECKNE